MLEEGNARRARLVLWREGEAEIAAAAEADDEAPSAAGEGDVSVPASLVEFVRRTGERVLLEDASADAGRFAKDPYFTRAHPRSVLGLPVRRQAGMVAVLYLENDLIPGAFTRRRLLALELVAAQAAISLENAVLLEQERKARLEAEAAVRLREEFLQLASHELRTPLTALRLSVQATQRLSAKGGLSAEQLGSNLGLVLSKTERLEQLAAEMLDAVRIGQGRLELRRTEVDLEPVVRGAMARLERESAAAGCRVSLACAVPAVGIWDAARLEQVFVTLLGNAYKFGARHPVEIRIERAEGLALVAVTDHGIGIDPSRLPRLFERFERGVSSTHYGGLGLGLYIARQLTEAHGGHIRVESEPGMGSTFTVLLPLRPSFS